jgi:hypothetical protein
MTQPVGRDQQIDRWIEQLNDEYRSDSDTANRAITSVAITALTTNRTDLTAGGPFDSLTDDQLFQLIWLNRPVNTWHTANLDLHAALSATVAERIAAVEQDLMADAHPPLRVAIGHVGLDSYWPTGRTVEAAADEAIRGGRTSRELTEHLIQIAIATKRPQIDSWSYLWRAPYLTCAPDALAPTGSWVCAEAAARLTCDWSAGVERWVTELQQLHTYLSGRTVLIRVTAVAFSGPHARFGKALIHHDSSRRALLVNGHLAYAALKEFRPHARTHIHEVATGDGGLDTWKDITGADVTDLTEQQQATALQLTCDGIDLTDAIATATALY